MPKKIASTLLAPAAVLAVAGTIGFAPSANAHGDEHGGEHDAPAAEIVTSEDAAATLTDAGVTLEATDEATGETLEDGRTRLSFPYDDSDSEPAPDEHAAWSTGGTDTDEEGDDHLEFVGGVEYTSDLATTEWEDPHVDTSDGLVSFDVAGERTDLLAVTEADETDDQDPEGEDPSAARSDEGDTDGDTDGDTEGDDEGAEYELVLTADGADALNEVAGDDAFAEGDVFATADGHDC
jgi:hypothetical protein